MSLWLTGAVLPIWKVLADTVLPDEDKKARIDTSSKQEQAHVVRLKLDSGEPIVGLSVVHDDVSKVSFMTHLDLQQLLNLTVHDCSYVSAMLQCILSQSDWRTYL